MTSLSWYVPDSHSVVWHFTGDARLSERARQLLRSAEMGLTGLIVPTIVLAELQTLYERRMPRMPLATILERLNDLSNVIVAPFDADVFATFRRLPGEIEIHDRIIAATAQHFGVPLISRDRVLQGQIPGTIWN
jgi:PIN domain nuclease of toxin-antitoxin system